MDNTKDFKDFAETGMTFLEYKDREAEIFNARANGSITRETMYKLLEDNRKAYNEWQDYWEVGKFKPATMKESLERADEARKRMVEKQREVRETWAKAEVVLDGDIKVTRGGQSFLMLNPLEARLLAAQILSLTNPKKKRS